MEVDVVRQFSQELASLYEAKPPISKAKMVQVTKAAIKGIKYYKHIVMAVEKFIHRCKPEYKLPGLYVIDSIVRQSRHQFGAEKDVFAPRFGKNILNTFQSLIQCVDEDKPKILRVVNLWLQNAVFNEDILHPVVDLAANIVIGDNVADAVEQKSVDTKNKRQSPEIARESRREAKNAPPAAATPPQPIAAQQQTTAKSAIPANQQQPNLDPGFLQQIQKLTSTLITQQKLTAENERRLTKKILSDYDYSDEESDDEESSEKGAAAGNKEPQRDDITANLAAAAQNLLSNPQLLQQIQQMQQSMRNPAQQQTPQVVVSRPQQPTVPVPVPVPPVPSGYRFPPTDFSVPPPNYPMVPQIPPPPPQLAQEQHPQPPTVARPPDPQMAANYPPPAEPLPPGFEADRRNQQTTDTDDRRRLRNQEGGQKKRKSSRDRSKSRSRSRDKKRKRKSRSRSGSRSARHRRNRSRSSDRRTRERERERRGLPPLKSKHVAICSRTLWLGRVPPYCEQDEIKQALKDYGEPVSIDLIPPRGCAYVVMPDRKSAYKVLDRLKDVRIQNRSIKMAWAPGKGVKKAYENEWNAECGATYLQYDKLPADLTPFLDGGCLDVESLPEHLKSVYEEVGKIGTVTAVPLPQQIPVPPTVPQPAVIMNPFPTYAAAIPPGGFPAPYPTGMPPPAVGMHRPPIQGAPPPMGMPQVAPGQHPPPTPFGVRIPPPPGGAIPSLLAAIPGSEAALDPQRYPYPPPMRGSRGFGNYRGRGRGFGPRPPWAGGVQPDDQSNYRGGGRGGWGSRFHPRRGGGGFYENPVSSDEQSSSTAEETSKEEIPSGGLGGPFRRPSRWGVAAPAAEEQEKPSTDDSAEETPKTNTDDVQEQDSNSGSAAARGPTPPPPPATVVEEREVEDEDTRYDQRGLANLLKMMSKQN